MTRLHVGVVALAGALTVGTAVPGVARAGDYDVQSGEWNGLQELVRIAQEVQVEIRPNSALDWGEVRRGDGLLVVYPLTQIDRADLTSFLEDGGRLAIFDDFGDAGPLLDWFRVARTEQVHGQPRDRRVPGLLIAFRRNDQQALAEGVAELITNEPVALSHPRLNPVFALSPTDDRQGVVLAGEVNGRGRIVISGDPSVLINSMLRFPGNRQFARNLLMYLAGRPRGRVHLVHSRFASRGVYYHRTRSDAPHHELVRTINDALARLSVLGGDAAVAHLVATLLALAAMFALAVRAWGARPSDRFGPSGPGGAAAGVSEKVAIFSGRAANMLYPSLIAKRYFERSLLRAVGLSPPTDVGAVLARAKARLSLAQQADLREVLIELDQLSTPAHEGGPARLSSRRFLSLWRRIGDILTALGGHR